MTQRIVHAMVSALTAFLVLAWFPSWAAATPGIAAGSDHTVALKNDGTVWAWGSNQFGQLGDGTTNDSHTPLRVTGPGGTGYFTGVTAIAAGDNHTVALRNDGTVWTWGLNDYGQLGRDNSGIIPAQVPNLSGVTAIAAEKRYTVCLKSDGTVWTWGYNEYGQLGDGSTTTSLVPVQVTGLTGVKAIAAGMNHVVALKEDGTVWAWGANYYGQLGNGTTTDSLTPVPVTGLSEVKAVTAGFDHTMALKNDGTVWAWGCNNYGQLGDGTIGERLTPVQVKGPEGTGYLTGVSAISAGIEHTVALKSDGTVWAWGDNFNGQLGDNTTTNRHTPVRVTGLTGVTATAIAAGWVHTVALKYDGTVWAWGANYFGELGDGTVTERHTPVQVAGLPGMGRNTVVAGSYHTVGLKEDGTVWAWGNNFNGQLGDGTTTERHMPVVVPGLDGVAALAAGLLHTVAVKEDGTVWTWGANNFGKLGDGTTTDRHMPVQASGLTGAIAVAAGEHHTVALKEDGTVWAWGSNSLRQLGTIFPEYSYTPTPIPEVSDVIAIAAGIAHNVALKQDGTVWAWGLNDSGQGGNGTTAIYCTPTQVLGPGGAGYLTGVVAIAAGRNYTLALKGDGTVWAWGGNTFGQLGDGTTSERHTPVQVSELAGVVAIHAGDGHTVALKGDGTVWAWGRNGYGQLGDGTAIERHTPVQISGAIFERAVVAGGYHSMALKGDGAVWAWGHNGLGQLGDGTTTNRLTPVQVAINLLGITSPGAPTNATAIAGNGRATVNFTPPASNGHSLITSYTVTSNPGAKTATGPAGPITVTGLTNGTAYTFTITATNSIGSGPASAPSNSVTPLYQPVSSVALVADPASPSPVGSQITFTAQASGGSGSYEYYFTCFNPSTGKWIFDQSYDADPTWTLDTTGLPAGTYTIEVWARNAGATIDHEAVRNLAYTLNNITRAKIGATGYATLNEAYSAASTTATSTILTLNTDLTESLVMNKGKKIVIIGGYNSAFSARTDVPTGLVGELVVGTGSLTVDGLTIK